jgi:FdrA protein
MNTNDEKHKQQQLQRLLTQKPVVVNIGLEGFADDLDTQQVSVIQLDWRPPAGGDAELADLLSRLGG